MNFHYASKDRPRHLRHFRSWAASFCLRIPENIN
jgi:hypothetical protein